MANDIRSHQLMMLEMLIEVDRICQKHNITYMLFAGTLLGAVRHQGFIPWDDDLDIMMMRSEYERFLCVAKAELDPELYYVQEEFSSHWPMFFSKIRRNKTTCIERYIPRDHSTHMGVYIDIFPCDNLYDNVIMRKLQFLASKFIIAKSLNERGYLTDSFVKKIIILLSHLIPKRPLIHFVKNEKGYTSKMVHTFFAASSKYKKNVYPRQWFDQVVLLVFEGQSFQVPLEYHKILQQLYGDYMTPISEEKRKEKVHGEIIDLEHSYTEYEGIQKYMKFDEYTRSIR